MWTETNNDVRGTYRNNRIKFKTAMFKSCLCDYSNALVLVKVII